MDDKAASKVERTEFGEEATAPYPVSHWIVDQDCPKQDEYSKSGEFHTLCKCTSNQCRCNNGEHALKSDEGELRNRAVFEDIHADTGEAHLVEAADEAVDIGAKCHSIADKHPLDGNHRNDEKALHDRCQNVFAADHASVKESKSRGHDEDQGCTDEDPGRISRINHGNQSFLKEKDNDEKQKDAARLKGRAVRRLCLWLYAGVSRHTFL